MNQYSVQPPPGYEDGYAPQEPLLPRDSFRFAKQQRAAGCDESPLVLTNCRILDTRTGQSSSYGHSVVLNSGTIQAVDAQIPPEGAIVINCHGMLLMPGTCVNGTGDSCSIVAATRDDVSSNLGPTAVPHMQQ